MAIENVDDLISQLHEDKNYALVADLYRSNFLGLRANLNSFEVAYALNEQGSKAEAEKIYEIFVARSPKNTSALNNLSNIKKEKGNIDEAFDLIQRAYKIDPEDEIISRNYGNLLSLVREREQITQTYQHALTYLAKENEFVIQKLLAFFVSARNDKDFKDNQLPIPRWKFKVMMSTDEQEFLRVQEESEDYEDLRCLREAKEAEKEAPTIGMAELKKKIGRRNRCSRRR